MMIVNRANCLKFLGRTADYEKTLNAIDWKPYDLMFRISVASIREDVEEVVSLMPKLVGHEYITPGAYRDWPVFKWIRDTEAFQRKFEEIYQEAFITTEKLDREMLPQEASEASAGASTKDDAEAVEPRSLH
jgi:hypothetical protein